MSLVSAGCAGSTSTADPGGGTDDEPFPERGLTIVSTSSAGAPIDLLAREIAAAVEPQLEQDVTVLNQPGGSGLVGMAAVAQAPADGYTLLIEATGVTSVTQLPSSPVSWEDFVPVARLELDPFVLFVNPDRGRESLQDLVDEAAASDVPLTIGGFAIGSPHHIRAVMFSEQAEIDMEWVSYDIGSDAMTALLGGNVDAVVSNASQIAKFGDEVLPLAHSAEKPLPGAPDVPSFADSGFEKLEGYHWRGILAKKGTPEPVLDRLHQAFSEAATSDRFLAHLDTTGNLDGTMPREEFVELYEGQAETDRAVLAEIGLLDD